MQTRRWLLALLASVTCSAAATVAGTVVGASGVEPAEGVFVSLRNSGTGEIRSIISDESGRFEFSNVGPGFYVLTGQVDRLVAVPLVIRVEYWGQQLPGTSLRLADPSQFYGNSTPPGESPPPEVLIPANLVLEIVYSRTLRGRLVDADDLAAFTQSVDHPAQLSALALLFVLGPEPVPRADFVAVAWRQSECLHKAVYRMPKRECFEFLNALHLATGKAWVDDRREQDSLRFKLRFRQPVHLGAAALAHGSHFVCFREREPAAGVLYFKKGSSAKGRKTIAEARVKKLTVETEIAHPEAAVVAAKTGTDICEIRAGHSIYRVRGCPKPVNDNRNQ